jgi:tetratricopeptide (TPR) repeat protein
MSEQSAQNTDTVVTSGSVGRGNRFNIPLPNKRLTIVVIILLLLGAAVWGIKAYHDSHTLKFPRPNMSTDQKYHYLADKGDYKGAEKILGDAFQKATTKLDKANLSFEQSALALQFKDTKNAKLYADQALKAYPGYSDAYAAEAYVAMAQGDKNAAKKYWQQAIDHIDPNRPGANIVKIDYQAALDAIK